MIDALFGSKTRVKLLHLFLSNPGKAFYVREITRLIDEQLNSVRRELANMLEVGIITSDASDNKLYYQVNQRFEHYVPLRAIFAGQKMRAVPEEGKAVSWKDGVRALPGLRLALAAGVLIRDQDGPLDLLLVGTVPAAAVRSVVRTIEKAEGREINYTVLTYDDFYYRLSIRDKFLTAVLAGKHAVIHDTDNILKPRKEDETRDRN